MTLQTINDYCLHILKSGRLEDKLLPPPEGLTDIPEKIILCPDRPERENRIRFSDSKTKIPRLEHLNQKPNRALTLHHFANHELMALELFAYGLLKFNSASSEHRKLLWKSLLDERKHLNLYVSRIRELGMDLGDQPLNYMFWKMAPKIQTLEKFTAVIAISLEGANLDYALIYKDTFDYFGDHQSAKIMHTIYRDEAVHVRRGLTIFRSFKPEGQTDWDYYTQLIEFPFTPRRAKGYVYFPETRRRVGLDTTFVEKLGEYQDEYTRKKINLVRPIQHRV